jgi:hypothetical protein
MTLTKHLGHVVSTPASYSGDPGFKSRPGDSEFSWFSSVPPDKFRNSSLNCATTPSFHSISDSSFTYYHFVRRCKLLKKRRQINEK